MAPLKKVRINFALTEEARDLLRAIADERGLSMNAALEGLIRDEAKRLERRKSKPSAP